jgi:hypothetical protein
MLYTENNRVQNANILLCNAKYICDRLKDLDLQNKSFVWHNVRS